MDAPPPRENVRQFVKVAKHLKRIGLRTPEILQTDSANGFVILEDFGLDTFTRLLAAGCNEQTLYEMAIDVLCVLHRHPEAAAIDVPAYDEAKLLEETLRFVDWHYPARCGSVITVAARQAYRESWQAVLHAMPETSIGLVLRDFHVDNLMRVVDDDQRIVCGLLDFQDAVIGAHAYDLMSLLEDARRDIDTSLITAMKARYFEAMPDIDQVAFEAWYAVLGAQRHSKIIGNFTRLCIRDGKCHYLDHIPRVIRLLRGALTHPALAPVNRWLDRYFPDWPAPMSGFDPAALRLLLAETGAS